MASVLAAGSCFTDLNVPVQCSKEKCRKILQNLADSGYECIALNHEMELAKKVRLQPVPVIDNVAENTSNLKTPLGRSVQVLQRLTVSSSPTLNTYDVLAVCPETEKAFKVACSSLDVDIISIKLDERSPFRLKPTQIGLAVDRGLHFEICYSPAIRDSTARRNILSNAMELVDAAKGKNIVVSSRAEQPLAEVHFKRSKHRVCLKRNNVISEAMETRAPADIVNLCQLFGIKSGKCKFTITSNCRAVRLHAAMRRKTVKGVVSCELIRQPTVTSTSSSQEAGGVDQEEEETTQPSEDMEIPTSPAFEKNKKRRRSSQNESGLKRTRVIEQTDVEH